MLTPSVQLGPMVNTLKNGKKTLKILLRVKPAGASKAARKPRSKAAGVQDVPAGYDSPSVAGPSNSSNDNGDWPPVRGKKRTYVPVSAALPEEAPPEKERSLYRDDPEPAGEDIEWFDDEIDEISSPPPPPARRMGTRGEPSASQSMVAGYDSDIEEVDAPYRITYIEPHDVADAGDPEDLSVRCRKDLVALRDEVRAARPLLSNGRGCRAVLMLMFGFLSLWRRNRTRR